MPTLTHLEMNDASWHTRSRRPPLALRPIHGRTVRDLTLRVGAPFAWPSQHWTDTQWDAYLANPAHLHWAPVLDDEPLGILSVDTTQAPDHEIDSFGLLPEHIGAGHGGPFLDAALDLVWQLPAHRVWLHTSSDDHPHALGNYLARGFRRFAATDPGDT